MLGLEEFQAEWLLFMRCRMEPFVQNVFPNIVSTSIKKQCGQKPTHPSVSIPKGVDAQKVMDEDWYQDERILYPFLQGFVECITKVFNRRCSLKFFVKIPVDTPHS